MKRVSLYLPFYPGGPQSWGKGLSKELIKKGYSVKTYDTLTNCFLQPFRPGICHSTLPFFTRPLFGKYILTIHGDFRNEPESRPELFEKALKCADTITVPSIFLKNKLGLKNCLVIPNGIDPSKNHKKDYSIQNKTLTVGILTSFNYPEKSRGVIELAKVIKKINLPIKLIIGGSGEELEKYESLVKQILPNTEFLGFCKKENLFSRIDIFTYYSFQDTHSIALLEAMEYGLPVISNDVGAINEILIDNLSGLIAKDPEEYLLKLIELTKNKEKRIENASETRERAREFHWEQIVPQWIDLYNK